LRPMLRHAAQREGQQRVVHTNPMPRNTTTQPLTRQPGISSEGFLRKTQSASQVQTHLEATLCRLNGGFDERRPRLRTVPAMELPQPREFTWNTHQFTSLRFAERALLEVRSLGARGSCLTRVQNHGTSLLCVPVVNEGAAPDPTRRRTDHSGYQGRDDGCVGSVTAFL